MLRMTEGQLADIQARMRAQARVVQGSCHTEKPEAKPKKEAVKPKRHNKPRMPAYEDHLADQLRKRGLDPVREYAWLAGRRYRADLAFPAERVIVEIDGAAHRVMERWKADIRKGQDAMMADWTLLRLLTEQVRTGEAAELVVKALAMKGKA